MNHQIAPSRLLLFAAALLAFLVAVPRADAKPQYCSYECSSSDCCNSVCTDQETGVVITCGQYGICNWSDQDCDGIGAGDNCPTVSNPGQQNCDGDAYGDACDSQNASYQYVSGSNRICYINGYPWYDGQQWNSDVYAYHQSEYEDVSSCGAPDIFVNSYNEWHTCYDEDYPYQCCWWWFGGYECAQNYAYYTCQF